MNKVDRYAMRLAHESRRCTREFLYQLSVRNGFSHYVSCLRCPAIFHANNSMPLEEWLHCAECRRAIKAQGGLAS